MTPDTHEHPWCVLLALPALLSCGSPPDEAGRASPPSRAPAAGAPVPLEVAITVDDLPVHGPAARGVDRGAIATGLLEAFAAHRVAPVTGFVNGERVEKDPRTEAILRRWLAAGHPLGNHTWSHPSLNATALPAYLADIERGEAILIELGALGAWKPFRYPFLYEGDTPDKRDRVRSFLRRRGYTIAPVSIDADDWAYNPPYARCTELGDRIAAEKLVADFVAGHVDELHRVRDLTRELVGRDIKHVLLLHIGVADAAAIDGLLTAYEREGVRWIDLPTALADPFYSLDTAEPVRYGAAAPYRLARERGVKAPPPVFARDLEQRLAATCR